MRRLRAAAAAGIRGGRLSLRGAAEGRTQSVDQIAPWGRCTSESRIVAAGLSESNQVAPAASKSYTLCREATAGAEVTSARVPFEQPSSAGAEEVRVGKMPRREHDIVMCVCVYIYIYIYIHTWREKSRERERERPIINKKPNSNTTNTIN